MFLKQQITKIKNGKNTEFNYNLFNEIHT